MAFRLDVSKCCSASISALPSFALIACGSFSPITNFHLRLFEDAKDLLISSGAHVVGGFLSPVHESYSKPGLASFVHRFRMCQLAVQGSSWIQVSGWEGSQPCWSRTVDSLTAHRDLLAAEGFQARMLLLCGSDLLQAFYDAVVWPPDQVEKILSLHGIAVMERTGFDLETVISGHPILSKYRNSIFRVQQSVVNNISSTLIRQLISERRSIKYLTQDAVIDYIQSQSLFQ